MTIAMYGMGPVFPGGRVPEFPPETPRGISGSALPYVQPAPLEPESADQLRGRLEARVAWLKNELRMHDAWQTELDALVTMLGALPVRVGDKVRNRDKKTGPVVPVTKVDGKRIYARWQETDSEDLWINREDVVLVERSVLSESGTGPGGNTR